MRSYKFKQEAVYLGQHGTAQSAFESWPQEAKGASVERDVLFRVRLGYVFRADLARSSAAMCAEAHAGG